MRMKGSGGETSEEGGGEQSIETDGRVYGGRRRVKMVLKSGERQGRGEDSSSALSVRETDTFEEAVFRRII